MSKLYASATNTTNILSAQVTNSYSDTAAMASFKAIGTTLGIGDPVSVTLGYEGDNSQVFSGYVKEVKRSQNPLVYDITAYDAMIRAADYFLASDDPDIPLIVANISAEDLIDQLMDIAGLTDFGYDATSFTFATQGPLEINLVTIYDYCKMISETLAWHLYADMNGKVWFVERWNRVMAGDTSDYTLPVGPEIISVSYAEDERDLRNRIVVYGGGGISASASAVADEGALPSGFYKTVVASAEWIDNQSMAQSAADKNLTLLNKVGKEVNVTFVGQHDVFVRDTPTFTYSPLGISGLWFVDTVDHDWGRNGFTTTLRLRK